MVSIIIPYYNRPKKIKRCVDSILNQTYQDFEILLVDDHSSTPLEIDRDNRIQIFRNTQNLGPGLSRNVGLEKAKGPYVAFLDSDDYWDKTFLSKTVNEIKNKPHVAFVYTNTLTVSPDGSRLKRNISEYPHSILPRILTEQRSWATSACLYRREIIGHTRYINARNWEDYAFDVEIGLHNNVISFIPESLCYYDSDGSDRLSRENFTDKLKERMLSTVHICNALQKSKYLSNRQIQIKLKKELLTSLEYYVLFTDKKISKKELFDAIKSLDKSLFLLVRIADSLLPHSLFKKFLNRLKYDM